MFKFREIFQKRYQQGEAKLSCAEILSFFTLTPFLLIYLLLIDIVFLLISSIVSPLTLLVSLITLGRVKLDKLNDLFDRIYELLFGMSKIDVLGFRRLRTSSQLTFESIPQVLFQLYILNKLSKDPA